MTKKIVVNTKENKEDISDVLRDWERFYQNVFGVKMTLLESKIKIPAHVEGFDRIIVVAQGMTWDKIFNKCKDLFPVCGLYEALSDMVNAGKADKAVKSERTSREGAYAVRVRDAIMPDKWLRFFSANELKEEGINGIALEERMLFELKYFLEARKHLDLRTITMCSGSCDWVGNILNVRWDSCEKMVVGYNDPDRRAVDLRSRQVIV